MVRFNATGQVEDIYSKFVEELSKPSRFNQIRNVVLMNR